QQIALEEIDLEISIRQRIAETIQSRLTWALLLQASVQRAFGQGSENFRTASLDALDAIEAPCDLIFNRESPLVPIPTPRPANNDPPPTPSTPEPPQMLRTGSRASRTRGFARVPPPKRLLFLRNTATTPPEIAKLACPQCSRFDFSNLQGILNHCRIRHQLEYGSHDECVQSCAVLVPEAEQEWVVQNGVEVAGISLPSLRRLFEIAVGAGDNVRLLPLPSKQATPAPTAPKTDIEDEPNTLLPPAADMRIDSSGSSTPQPTAHVTKTLGYHVDTPALAQFLGRTPKKRRINVRANEDNTVDIEDPSAGSGLQRRNMWRKLYTHRNAARKELDEVVPLSELRTNGTVKNTDEDKVQDPRAEDVSSKEKSHALQMLAGTRFHIAARVQVSDFSLYIPPNRRSADRPAHSYRWRLAVTSPSYSLPISSVLSKLSVSSATDPPPSALSEPITLSEPPFVLTGTTDQPFLARLAFTWAGIMNAQTEIEHWVELDPMQYTTAQLGEEQVFDVELDRRTDLLPVREDVRDISWEDVRSAGNGRRKPDLEQEQEQEQEQEPEWVGKLRSVLPRFPMIMRGTKGRIFSESDKLPYTLVSTPAQFRNLHYGRRKAIEMGRARTLREAYAQLVSQPSQDSAHQSLEAPTPVQRDTTAHAIPADAAGPTQLSTAEVFHWLEDEGLFPRSKAAISQGEVRKRNRASKKVETSGPPAYCRTCGLERAWHLTVREEHSVADNISDTKTEIMQSTSAGGRQHKDVDLASLVCMAFQEGEATRSPVVNVDMLLQRAGRLVVQEYWEGMSYSLHPAIFARGAVHEEEEDQGEDLSASRPFVDLFPVSAELNASELNAALVQVADPRLVTTIGHMTGLPSPRYNPFQASIEAGTQSSRSSLAITSSVSSRRLWTTASCPTSIPSPLVPGVGDHPRDAVNALLAPSALLAIAMRSFVRHIVGRGAEALHHDEAALRNGPSGGRQKHLQPHGRGRRNMDATESVRRVLTPTHVLSGLVRHAGAGLVDSAALLVCATLGESSRRDDSTATDPACAGGGRDVDEDGSRLATGSIAR
ncbi:hypothetical protein LXA43DRAFT_891478, partial [Ganoderma leucocontextum]